MAERLLSETPVEFFREQLLRAMQHQHVATSALTEYYLVNLLSSGVRGAALQPSEPGFDEAPLALLYARAVAASRYDRPRLLRTVGDVALFVSGFFADSLTARSGDPGYYRSLGGFAYAYLGREPQPVGGLPDVFSELARRFMEFADVLSEVSETSRLTSSLSLLRLYERWVRTGSARAAALLAERGIAPLRGGGESLN